MKMDSEETIRILENSLNRTIAANDSYERAFKRFEVQLEEAWRDVDAARAERDALAARVKQLEEAIAQHKTSRLKWDADLYPRGRYLDRRLWAVLESDDA